MIQEVLFNLFLFLTVVFGFVVGLLAGKRKTLEKVLFAQLGVGLILSLIIIITPIEWIWRFVFWVLGILFAEVVGFYIMGKKPIGYLVFGIIFLLIGMLLGGGTLV